jgi:hypothetical protein
MALFLFLFAKVPFFRFRIDKYLGNDFISYHHINMKAVQFARVVSVPLSVLALKHGDDYLTTLKNHSDIMHEAQTAQRLGLPTPSEKRMQEVLDRPSTLTKLTDASLEGVRQGVQNFFNKSNRSD